MIKSYTAKPLMFHAACIFNYYYELKNETKETKTTE